VVFTGGLPDKNEYRRFKIQTTEEGKPDDFKSMAEVMTRRFRDREASEKSRWPDPDLIIIDGGKGQLSSAVEALKQIGIEDLPIVSLAKKFEEVFLPGQSRPIVLPRDSTALFLLQNIRDEAHRFAITYHRSLRSKAQTASYLDGVKGIGAKRKETLLTAYPVPKKFLAASPEDIAACLSCSLNVASELLRQVRLMQEF
jgi:excinuclease ABC subunit C